MKLSAVPDPVDRPGDEPPGWSQLRASFVLSLRAARRSPLTVRTYLGGADAFATFLQEHAPGVPVEAATRDHLRAYLVDLADRGRAPNTVLARHRALRALFKSLLDDEVIATSPMAAVRPPTVTDEKVPPALDATQVEQMVKACPPKHTFLGARDRALILVLASSGLRASECLGLVEADLVLDSEMPYVIVRHGKGDRSREAAVSHAAAKAVLGYLRQRVKHHDAHRPELWLGRAGAPLTVSGLRQMVKDAGRRVGLDVHSHALRHTATHQMLDRGMQEHDVMVQLGHKGTKQLARYGKARAVQRSREDFFRSQER